MTEAQKEHIVELTCTDNPFMRAVYESFLTDNNATREICQSDVLLDIIRAHCVILNQGTILKSPVLFAVQAYIQVYNILFAGEYQLLEYIPHFFIKEEVDEDASVFFNETICLGSDNKYYLCDCGLKPMDRAYETMEELLKVHNLDICVCGK